MTDDVKIESYERVYNKAPLGDRPGSGPGGYCICPACGYRMMHDRLQPCNEIACPKCGEIMTRE